MGFSKELVKFQQDGNFWLEVELSENLAATEKNPSYNRGLGLLVLAERDILPKIKILSYHFGISYKSLDPCIMS